MDQENFQFHTKKVDQIVRRELVNVNKWEAAVDEDERSIRRVNITDDLKCNQALLIHKAECQDMSGADLTRKLYEQLEKQISSLDDLAVDIFDIILSKCLAAHKLGHHKVVVYADEICEMRDNKKRGNSFQSKQKDLIEERIKALANVHIHAEGFTTWTKDKRGKIRKTTANYRSPLFLISGYKEEKLLGDDDRTIIEHRHAWEVVSGALFTAIAGSISAPQYINMPKKVLAYDPKYYANVKRLSKAIFYYFRVNFDLLVVDGQEMNDGISQTRSVPMSVQKLLQTAGISLPTTKKRLDFRRAFDHWLDKLEEDQVIKTYEYKNESFESGEKPSFESWLLSIINIYPTDDLIHAYSQSQNEKKTKPKELEQNNHEDDASIIRLARFREEHNLSIRDLAAKIQLPASTVSMLLSRRRRPSLKMSAKIMAAFPH